MFNIDKFSKRYIDLCEERNLFPSGTPIAKALSVSHVTLGNYVNKVSVPKIDIIYRMAIYFDVDSDYLLGLSDIKKKPISIIDVHRLSKQKIKLLQSYAKFLATEDDF